MEAVNKKSLIFYAIGIVSGIIFFVLLGFRLDLFNFRANNIKQVPKSPSEKESWMNIIRNGRKIGYSHRSLVKTKTGFSISDKTYIRVKVMGMVQGMQMKTEAGIDKNSALSSFSFNLNSGVFNFYVKGKVEGKTLKAFINEKEIKFPLDQPIYLFSQIIDVARTGLFKTGDSKTFHIFDPSSMSRQPVSITKLDFERIKISGELIKAEKYLIEYMGISQTLWADETGDVLMEKGLMGITMVKASQSEAVSGFADAKTEDLTEAFAIASNIKIKKPEELGFIKINIYGADRAFFLNGGRQNLLGNQLTVTKEKLPDSGQYQNNEEEIFLRSSPAIQSDHPLIKQKTAEIISLNDSQLIKAEKILNWIYNNIEKQPTLSVPNAYETLKNRTGDCNEHAVLFAAMARACRIPAQIETGLVYLNGRFYYHAWNNLYLGKWITADATLGQMPADVTHIRLIRGETREQIDLIRAIGAIKIEIIETSK